MLWLQSPVVVPQKTKIALPTAQLAWSCLATFIFGNSSTMGVLSPSENLMRCTVPTACLVLYACPPLMKTYSFIDAHRENDVFFRGRDDNCITLWVSPVQFFWSKEFGGALTHLDLSAPGVTWKIPLSPTCTDTQLLLSKEDLCTVISDSYMPIDSFAVTSTMLLMSELRPYRVNKTFRSRTENRVCTRLTATL